MDPIPMITCEAEGRDGMEPGLGVDTRGVQPDPADNIQSDTRTY